VFALAAMLGFFAFGCQSSVAGNVPADASSGTDGVTAGTVDASADVSALGSRDAAFAYDGPCVISASAFDQSCTVDTDCVEVTSTNYCAVNCQCGGSAINVDAMAEFYALVGATPLGSGALGPTGCPCPSIFGPCCRNATCTGTCFSPSDTLAACADAGGTCFPSGPGGPTRTKSGPPDACAYSDETCCLN
jgi:hypothetical protein